MVMIYNWIGYTNLRLVACILASASPAVPSN